LLLTRTLRRILSFTYKNTQPQNGKGNGKKKIYEILGKIMSMHLRSKRNFANFLKANAKFLEGTQNH